MKGTNSFPAREIVRREPLSAGHWGAVERVHFRGGGTAIRKTAAAGHPGISIEAEMLRFLADHSKLPVPGVLACDEAGLWLEDIPGVHDFSTAAQRHGAELLASLHAVTPPNGMFGFDTDTLIGPLPQRNGWCESWPAFFRERRLLAMAQLADESGVLPQKLRSRLELLSARLDELLPAHPPASLVHGDVWAGNVLSSGDRITAFLDPSLSYSHAEVELAFIGLFSTFGPSFYQRYGELRAIEPEFFKVRKDVYNLYPLLVHARLFGAAYLVQIDGCLRRLGF